MIAVPTLLAGFLKFVTSVLGTFALVTTMFDSLMQAMICARNSPLAVVGSNLLPAKPETCHQCTIKNS